MNCREHCRKFGTEHCFHPGMQQCAGFEEKEKPMENKVIFESRKDIINFGMLIKNCMDGEHLIQIMASYDISFRKSQNRFANIADRVLREADTIDKKIGKFIGKEEL